MLQMVHSEYPPGSKSYQHQQTDELFTLINSWGFESLAPLTGLAPENQGFHGLNEVTSLHPKFVMDKAQDVAATPLVHQQRAVTVLDFGDAHQGTAQALLPLKELFASMQMFKGAECDITGSAFLACATGAHPQPGELFKQGRGRVFRWDETGQWFGAGSGPTCGEKQWTQAFGKFDQRRHVSIRSRFNYVAIKCNKVHIRVIVEVFNYILKVHMLKSIR